MQNDSAITAQERHVSSPDGFPINGVAGDVDENPQCESGTIQLTSREIFAPSGNIPFVHDSRQVLLSSEAAQAVG